MHFIIQTKSWSSAWNRLSTVSKLNQVISQRVLTEAQELFSLFFAIYFGLIIDRSHEMYKSWDTYNVWKGKSHNIKRLLAAWIILGSSSFSMDKYPLRNNLIQF